MLGCGSVFVRVLPNLVEVEGVKDFYLAIERRGNQSDVLHVLDNGNSLNHSFGSKHS